jgi:hypothetical protein
VYRVIGELRAAFARHAFVDLTAVLPPAWRDHVAHEVTAVLDTHAVRRDVRIAATGDTPRRYRVADRDALVAACPLTARIYRSATLISLVSAIAGEAVVPVPYVPEELIATRLERAGDTHGWHWDDYAFALVWVLRAPPAADGATLEYITNVPWNKAAPRVDALLAEREPVRAPIAGGTAYLLRTDTTLHRVTPLRRDAVRDALCLSYAAKADVQRAVSHETLDTILASNGVPA